MDLICLGNATIDDVVLPDGTTRMSCFGGDAIYASLAASYWTDEVQFVAPIGRDYPQTNLDALRLSGWDLRGMPRREVPGIRSWVVYEYDGRRTWIARNQDKDFQQLSPTYDDIPADFHVTRSYLILAMDLHATEELVGNLAHSGAIIGLDPLEDYIKGNENRIVEMLRKVDIYLPSQIEVEYLSGHRDYHRAAREYAALGCRLVVIKLGSAGSLIYDSQSQEFIEIPAYNTRVVDTTGAGDSYSGGFMAMYMRSQNLVESGLAGSVSASFAVEDFGLNRMLHVDRKTAVQRWETMLMGCAS